MKKFLHATLALSFCSLSVLAQNNEKLFATTAPNVGSYQWNEIRSLDEVSTNFKRTFINQSNYNEVGLNAALGFDEVSGRLYFIPMYGTELRWIDVDEAAGSEATVTTAALSTQLSKDANLADEAQNFTRMVVLPNRIGYALTNDGSTLLKFSTDAKPIVTNLGAVVDDPANQQISFKNRCTSWGGDMVADASGNLHVFSAGGHYFVVNPQTRIATYKGFVAGLPQGFTINGVAVNKAGNILLSSANNFSGLYEISADNLLQAKPYKVQTNYVGVSDLASPYVLFANKQLVTSTTNATLPSAKNGVIFPNPIVNESSFQISMPSATSTQKATVIVTDASGKVIQTASYPVNAKYPLNIRFTNKPSAGLYTVRVLDDFGKEILQDKLIVR